MKFSKIKTILFLFIISLSFAQNELVKEERAIQNLQAFTKLYGYIRYFHPSDEASQIDWEHFAMYGASRVKSAKNNEELLSILKELFLPLAPTMTFYQQGENPSDFKGTLPKKTEGLKVVAWQHRGVGFGKSNSIYASARVNRRNKISKAGGFGNIMQSLDATPYQGKTIRMRAYVKAKVRGAGNQGQLWLRVDRTNKKPGFFDNMGNRPITKQEWKQYEITGLVDKDAKRITFGCFLLGDGEIWLDQFQLVFKNAKGEWEPIPIRNSDFEANSKSAKGWYDQGPGYTQAISTTEVYEGKQAFSIARKSLFSSTLLFPFYPKVGEVAQKEIFSGFLCQFPLALYSDDSKTLGENKNYPLADLLEKMNRFPRGISAAEESVRLAAVVIAWNIFQHFYPYFDVVGVDWEKVLAETLKNALPQQDELGFHQTLSLLVAKLRDGHGGVYHRVLYENSSVPFRVDWVEEQIVVIASKDTNKFRIGDIVLKIDEVPAKEVVMQAETYLSGSPQWKRYRALSQFGRGKDKSKCRVLLKRNDVVLGVEVERYFKEEIPEYSYANIERLENNMFYVNLDKATMKEINSQINELAKAKGIIFDLRGYPKGNHLVINHLLDKPDTSTSWMRIPQICYPDQEKVQHTNSGWSLKPLKPHFQGKAVFLTDGRAISYAESFLSLIEHYKLADIVGQPTAGANGNINPFLLPGGYSVSWTGMKVLKHDGSQHHLLGVQPTVPLKRTLKGILDQRDEFLEKAKELINATK